MSIEKDLRIRLVLRIGVTGHRRINNEKLIQIKIKKVLIEIIDKLIYTPYELVVLSPLAEGADRIVAREIMNLENRDRDGQSSLEAILPLPVDEYIKDFGTLESREEFRSFLDSAESIGVLPEAESREASYENVGRYVVEKSDILMAIWNGKRAAGRGGTSDIINYALDLNRYIVWIDSESGDIIKNYNQYYDNKRPPSVDPLMKSIGCLDSYNEEHLNKKCFKEDE